MGDCDVPAVADHVDELRVREELGQKRDVQGIPRALVGPARLPGEVEALLERGLALLPDNGLATRTVSSELPPAEAITAVARDEGADMIIVGATGTGYVTRALLGSTAENLVRQAPCDVLVVR